MRAVECVVPNCEHLHAEGDPDLVATLLRHVRETHPNEPFGEEAAASLVEQAGYADLKHSKKGDWVDTVSATKVTGASGLVDF